MRRCWAWSRKENTSIIDRLHTKWVELRQEVCRQETLWLEKEECLYSSRRYCLIFGDSKEFSGSMHRSGCIDWIIKRSWRLSTAILLSHRLWLLMQKRSSFFRLLLNRYNKRWRIRWIDGCFVFSDIIRRFSHCWLMSNTQKVYVCPRSDLRYGCLRCGH